ncbi:MAG: D-aminoacyl-tRNA deacylase [Gammaproteobacteria bacterium]|nr:D-aminoacyl-tRNA deacylase [Gammaproteobacteria bacterium]
MRALCQRVAGASVDIGGDAVARIDGGLLVLLGVFRDDTEAQAERLAAKTLALRVFADASKPMNRSVMDVGGSVMVVSQFTLAADTSRGNRPGFGYAAEPERARALYEHYVGAIRERWPQVATGVFGTDMQVSLVNDGPVTILLEG